LTSQIPLKPQISVIIYRIIQELIHNVRKHSQSPICFVQIVQTVSGISISVEEETEHGSSWLVLEDLQHIGGELRRRRYLLEHRAAGAVRAGAPLGRRQTLKS